MCAGRPETVGKEFDGGRRRHAHDQPEREAAGAVRRAGSAVALLQRGPGRRAAADHYHAGNGGPDGGLWRRLVERRLRGHARADAATGPGSTPPSRLRGGVRRVTRHTKFIAFF